MSNSKYNIKSEEDLIKHFHSIHNFIRNQFGQYGKNALLIFNFFLGLRLIEPLIRTGKIKLSSICYFSDLKNLEKIYLPGRIKDIMREIYEKRENKGIKDALFSHLPWDRFDDKNNNLGELIARIDAIDMKRFDVAGRNYEYFIGFIQKKNKGSKSGSQIDDLGQYFTRRELGRYMVYKVNPQLKNNNVPSMSDEYCGSGGFNIEYIRFFNKLLNLKTPEQKNKFWGNQISNIWGYDVDDQIVKSTRVELLSLTNTVPYKTDEEGNYESSNIMSVNSFTYDFDQKFDYIFTNPPYGGDKDKDKDDKVKLKDAGKEIKHIAKYGSINKNETTIVKETSPKKKSRAKPKEYIITGDNKETLSLLLGMGTLNKNGTYSGVLKQGVFFDNKFRNMRKELIENYEIEYVISVPQNDFMHTATKTSILIFKNTGNKTKQIKFCDVDIIRQEIINADNEKEIHVIGIREVNPITKEEISYFDTKECKFTNVKDNYLVASYEDLVNKDYTLNYKSFIKEDIKVGKGFKKVKLGDIVTFKSKMKHPASEGKDNGLYRFYTSSEKIKYCDFLDVKDEVNIILGTGGKGSLFLDDTFSCSADNFVIKTDDENLTAYIYYYLQTKWEQFIDKLFNGSTLGHINKENLSNYEIVIPESIDTIKLYLNYLNPTNKSLQSLQSLQSLLKEKEQSICGKIKLLTMMGDKGKDYDEYKLGDILTVKAGPYIKTYEKGNIPIIGGGNVSNYTNNFSHENDWVIHKDGVSHKIISFVSGKYFLNHHGWSFEINKDFKNKTDKTYIGYWILARTEYYLSQLLGSNQSGINQETFYNFTIRILKPEVIKKFGLDVEFEFMDKLRNDIQNTLKCQEEITKQMMKLVLEETTTNDEEDETNEEGQEDEEQLEEGDEEYQEEEEEQEEDQYQLLISQMEELNEKIEAIKNEIVEVDAKLSKSKIKVNQDKYKLEKKKLEDTKKKYETELKKLQKEYQELDKPVEATEEESLEKAKNVMNNLRKK
jgi:type I restriction-modification system DNA methylase subunit